MADQNDTAPLIVIFQVIVPSVCHIAVGPAKRWNDLRSRNFSRSAHHRDLPIFRRVHPADVGEAGELLLDNPAFFGTFVPVRIGTLVQRNCGVDVEAIYRRIFRRIERLESHRAIGPHYRGRQILIAGVFATGQAEPFVLVGIKLAGRIVRGLFRRHRLLRINRRAHPDERHAKHGPDHSVFHMSLPCLISILASVPS